MFKNFNLTVNNTDKIAFVGPMGMAKTELFEILTDKQNWNNLNVKQRKVNLFFKDNSQLEISTQIISCLGGLIKSL